MIYHKQRYNNNHWMDDNYKIVDIDPENDPNLLVFTLGVLGSNLNACSYEDIKFIENNGTAVIMSSSPSGKTVMRVPITSIKNFSLSKFKEDLSGLVDYVNQTIDCLLDPETRYTLKFRCVDKKSYNKAMNEFKEKMKSILDNLTPEQRLFYELNK